MGEMTTRQQTRLMDGSYKARPGQRGNGDARSRLVRRYVFVCEYILAARDDGDATGERRARARAHYLARAIQRYTYAR